MAVNNTPKPTFIDLFAGCGGLSLGLMNAGWQGVFAIEKDADAFKTLRHNLVENRVDNRRLKQPRPKFDWPDWLEQKEHAIERLLSRHKGDLENLQGTIDLVAGGPPCQGFSFIGRRKANDPRNKLFKKYLEFVEIIKPKLILIENVKGIAVPHGKSKSSKSESYADRIKSQLEKLGYNVAGGQKIIRACDFGVPQFRPRHFTIGILKDAGIEASEFFERLDKGKDSFLRKKDLEPGKLVTVADAISDLCDDGDPELDSENDKFRGTFYQIKFDKKKSKTKYQELMRDGFDHPPNSLRLANHRPETVKKFELIQTECTRGTSLSNKVLKQLAEKHPTFERKRDGKMMDYKWGKKILTVLSKDQPSHTITTLPDDLLHYGQPRILTVRECARLQSFPDWFAFQGKYTTGGARRTQECPRYTQVGNAVAPLLAEVIGYTLKDILFEINLAVGKDAA